MKSMFLARMKLVAVALTTAAAVASVAAMTLTAAEPGVRPAPKSPKLKSAPANTWVKLAEEKSGGRDTPLFCYAPNVGKFILAGGVSRKPQHFDTEFFDAGAGKWTNAHPKNGPYRKESGPTDAPGGGKGPFYTDKAGVARIRMSTDPSAYVTGTRLYFQYAFDAAGGKLYAYFHDRTGVYDPLGRKWSDLGAAGFSKTSKKCRLIYGSLAYDPVNKEILSLGGTSDQPGGTPGTWAFSIAARTWKRVETGSKELRALGAEAEALRAEVDALANAARNRFYVTESEKESKEKLAERTVKLTAGVEALAGKLKSATLSGREKKTVAVAAECAGKLVAALKGLAGKLRGEVGKDALADAWKAQELAQRAARALDAEPCGRGCSQMASDLAAGKIVLFGGSRLGGYLSDTWVYDCKLRVWEQRWPKQAPSSRAGHTLAWLPKSGRIVLAGGSSRPRGLSGISARLGDPIRDLWTYDVKTNTWKLLARSKEGPTGGPGAADTADQLVVVQNRKNRYSGLRVTWGMRVDPGAAGAAVLGGSTPGTVDYGASPADYDKAATPDPGGMAKFLKELPPNRWRLMPVPPKGTAKRDWGTLPYDTDRHQILNWGGGHSTYIGTDVAHYSLRTATWSIGYAPEDVPTRGFYAFAEQTFRNRPHVPNHVWDSAAYDPVSQKGVWCVRGRTWTYAPATREWDYPPAPLPVPGMGPLHCSLATTPKGVVCWASGALYLFDAKAGSWRKLPLTGGKIGAAYGDRTGMCYDSKRDCLWLSSGGAPMMRYDVKSGALTVLKNKGAVVFMRETVYVPEIDMLLNMMRWKNGKMAGNLAFDIEAGKWVGLDLPFEGKNQYISSRQYWAVTDSRSLHYDPTYKVALFFYTWKEVGALRLEKTGLKTFEVKPPEPKKQ